MAGTQTRRKRRIGAYLRTLRERAGKTPEDAAAFLGVQRPTITRQENGESLCRRVELPGLCVYYGASDDERAEALTLWEDAKQDSTRIVLPGSTPRQLRSYLRAEEDAGSQKVICGLTIHGLVQTRDYATAITSAPSGYRLPDNDIERVVEARLARQRRLRGASPMRLHVVMDEGLIHRVVGGPAVMAEQLRHLLQLMDQPHITIQVVPYEAGAYGAMAGEASVLEFPDPADPPAAYVEYIGDGRWVEDEEDVSKLATTFDLVAGAAATPVATADLLQQQIEALTNHDQQLKVAEE